MLLKRVLLGINFRLYTRVTSIGNAVNNVERNNLRQFSFSRQIAVKRIKIKHRLRENQVCCSARQTPSFVDTGQRNLHVASKDRSEKLTAAVEQEEHENLSIEPPVPHDVLVSRLKDCITVEEQMSALRSTLSLTSDDIKMRISLCDNIKNMLEPFFDDFKVQLYGSSVNGFGFKGCDIDMSFSVNVSAEDVMKSSFDDSDIPSLEDVLSGKVSREHISKLSPKDQLVFIHFVFLDYFKESIVAPLYINAYIPIIRFNFDKYNLKCDLTCGNRTALGNTKLLYFYANMDERVIPLMMTLRYWAKNAGLIGGGLMFNTYTVSLMVIYFLQTRNPPILPPAEYLLSVSEALRSDYMYDKSLLKDIEKIPPSKNTESLEELFREFFFYYLYFDFTHVICPLKGYSVPRDIFCATENSNKKFRLNTICVQDPIKLTHNVANLVNYRHCRKFAQEMLTACKLLQNENFWLPNSNEWGLVSLFKRTENINCNDDIFLNFEIPLKLFPYQNLENETLVLKASELVLQVFQQALLFECDAVQNAETVDGNTDDCELLFIVKCTGHHNTWLGRNCVKLEDEVGDPLEQERLISLKLCEQEKEEKRKEFTFICKCYAVRRNGQLSLHVKLTPLGKIEFSPVLGIFLKEYVPRTVRSLL